LCSNGANQVGEASSYRGEPLPTWLADYVPFVGLTVGYIGLRMVLFGNAVREQSLTPDVLAAFVVRLATYVKMMAVGSALVGADEISPDLALAGRLAVWVLLTVALLAALVEMVRVARGRQDAWWGPLLFFGPLWWTISVVPMVVTYESARHLYQASAGVAVAFGVGFEALWVGDRLRRAAAVLAATALIVLGTKQLDQPLEVWQHSGRISARIQQDLNRELAAAPAGSLVVVAPPPVGASDLYHSWLRMWSMPFAVEPPFAPPGLAERVALVVPPDVYCCPRDQWYAATRSALTAWASQPARGPIIVLRWDGWSGGLIRRTERDDAQLPGQMLAVGAAPTPATMCQQLDAVVGNLAASCTDS
jgi:hypothetical protein